MNALAPLPSATLIRPDVSPAKSQVHRLRHGAGVGRVVVVGPFAVVESGKAELGHLTPWRDSLRAVGGRDRHDLGAEDEWLKSTSK
jgi:hypothetical protein